MTKLFHSCAVYCLPAIIAVTGFAQPTQTANRSPQTRPSPEAWDVTDKLRNLLEVPAVSGYEQDLARRIAGMLASQHPQTDNLGDVAITLGSGSPHRLIVAPIDEPGFVVSGINDQGYLTLQRLPQGENLPLFNELYSAEPVKIGTAQQRWMNGSVAGLSIHLLPQRQQLPSLEDLDNLYIDIGAASSAEARAAGVDILDPLALDRHFYEMANGRWASPSIGDRFGAAILLDLVGDLDPNKIKGMLTVAFVGEQWLGARGLQRIIESQKPDELIYVGRVRHPAAPSAAGAGERQAPTTSVAQQPGSGVLVAVEKPGVELVGLAGELKQLAAQNNIALKAEVSAPLLPRGGYLPQPHLPERTVHLAIATAWPSTPAEFIDAHDLANLKQLLEIHLQGAARPIAISRAPILAEPPAPKRPVTAPPNQVILKTLTETYGVSGHEANVRQAVTQLLPAWAKPEADDAGNLILHWTGNGKGPRTAVVAHMDEIGFEVKSIRPDGKLELEQKGGGVLAYYLGHQALVHSTNGMHPGVMELPEGWDKPGFRWPAAKAAAFRMDVGAFNPEQVAELGIKPGDFVTIPKQYRQLHGPRASGRAFDDRVGCSALISAVWALGPNLHGRDVTFIWSTREELGLEGASAAARKLAMDGETPTYVFAVDTFVSSDSPLESPRFADALLGRGFVVRGVDNSNIVPRNLAMKVVAMARKSNIAVQYGATNGGNDGAAFLLYGAIDVAVGWPLRYSHSPAEVIDLRDLDALARIVTEVAGNW
jgi:putative aminopeptidase FrvX